MRYLIIITNEEQKRVVLEHLFKKGYTWMSRDRRLDRGRDVKYINVNESMAGRLTYGEDAKIMARHIASGTFVVLSPDRVTEVPAIVTRERR